MASGSKTLSSVRSTSSLLFSCNARKSQENGPRHGKLCLQGRRAIETPHYLALSSRGTVPHLSQDMMRDNTTINALYTALEDYIEKAPERVPPVYKYPTHPNDSPLRRFISLPQDILLVLGPRRIPPLPSPTANSDDAVSIATSIGFSRLTSRDYVEATKKLRPDIILGLGDVAAHPKPSQRRMERMADRTLGWMKELIAGIQEDDSASRTVMFAPILPLNSTQQKYYLSEMENEYREIVSGLVLYEASSTIVIPDGLSHLPRLSIEGVDGPHALLDGIFLGIDLFTVPFIDAATDAGIALDFVFPPKLIPERKELLALGIDLWSTSHATDLSALRADCQCYTCVHHHRAFLHHLLGAKEMLGWVLLQLHNHHVLQGFFAGVRQSLTEGSFNTHRETFAKTYTLDLPTKTGQGPRIRGYQFKSEGKGEPRKNPIAYRQLNDESEKLAEANPPSPDTDAEALQRRGFAEKMQ